MDATRGPCRPPITREKLLAQALRILDEEGIDSLSMRRLGQACGVQAMSLYHHLRDKATLLDGVNEAVYASIELPDVPAGTPWEVELAAVARAIRDALLRHPGALPIVSTRFPSGPAAFRVTERLLAILRGTGLPPAQALYASNAIGFFLIGFALAAVGRTPGAPQEFTDEQWAAQFAPVTDDAYPAYAATLREAPYDRYSWDELFELGLTAMIEGLRVRVQETVRS